MEELYLTFRGNQVFLTVITSFTNSKKIIEESKYERNEQSARYKVDNSKEVLQKFVELKGYTEVSKRKIHLLPENWSYKLNLWSDENKALVQLATIIFN